MPAQHRPIYKEWSSWPGWLLVVFWGTILVSMAFVGVVGEGDADATWALVSLAGTALLIQWVLGGLTVRLYRDHMTVGLGTAGFVKKRIVYEDILRTEAVTYRPLAEFGGWGVRWGREGKKAWTARGDQAVILHLADGTRLYVGSDKPHHLEQRIRAVAGTRMGAHPGA